MKVIGAGLPRTGTMSVQAALKQLGYRCYHMQEVPREPGHLRAWNDAVSGRTTMDWHTLFRNYEATVDAPACFYYADLLRTFPGAKVILTVRDPERWYQSVMTLIRTTERLRPLRYLIPKLALFLRLGDSLNAKFFDGTQDKDRLIQAFNAHNAAVQHGVPQERLLVFRVQDGWEPLCAFLGCAVPQLPFPHLNEGDATLRERFRQVFLSGPLRNALLAAGLLGLSLLAWLFFV